MWGEDVQRRVYGVPGGHLVTLMLHLVNPVRLAVCVCMVSAEGAQRRRSASGARDARAATPGTARAQRKGGRGGGRDALGPFRPTFFTGPALAGFLFRGLSAELSG